MKPMLKSVVRLYHYVNGKKVPGPNPDMSGDCSRLWGDCNRLWGNGTGLRGDCTGVCGNLDDCEITDEDRAKGININDLVLNKQEVG